MIYTNNTPKTLNFVEEGNPKGPVIAVTPGWGVDISFIKPIAKLLKDCRVLLIDMPGYGINESYASIAGDLEATAMAILNTLPENTVLVTWSLSSLTGIKACLLDHKRKIKGLVTICGVPRFPSDPNWSCFDYGYIIKCRQFFDKHRALKLLRLFFILQSSNQNNSAAIRTFISHSVKNMPIPTFEVLLDGIKTMLTTDLRVDLEHLDIPVLHLFGRKDRLVKSDISSKLASCGHNCQVFEKSAHMPFLSEPELFKRTMENFIVKANKSAAAI